MTAILTKQNARDKAFVGGNNTPTTNGEFETLHIKGDATIDGKIENEQITNIETRIKTLEETPADGLPFEDGLNDFIINAETLKTFETDEYNILEIAFESSTNYEGEVFELIFPSNMNLSNGIISMSNGKFNNPRITFNETYLMDYINDDDKPRLYMNKTLIDKPLDLFTSGFIRINYIAKTKQNVNTRENQLINLKCNQIDADNCFKLYRSPLPDFYEMKSYGITDDKNFYYADYGYLPGSPEFEALIDGQTFEFHDEAFGTDYKMTKQGNEWIGNNLSYHIPISATIKGETKFFKHQTQAIFIKQNETNKAILRTWIKYYSEENPFKIINEKGLLKFVDCVIDKYDSKDGYWSMYLKCTQKKTCNFSCSLMINNIEYQTEFGFEYSSYEAESCYKVNTNNCYEYLPFHHNGKLEVGNPPYGLKLYMMTDKELIFKIADVNYEEGMNTFEFLASTGYYTVSPRPESCTTLFTNYNIQTSGVVIGENIESHVFVLNSLGNTVDIAVNHISELQNYCVQLQQQIEEVKNKQNWFDIVKDVVCIAGASVNFMGGPGKLLSIAEKGISNLLGVSFAADEELIEEAAIVACDRASVVLADVKREVLEFINEEELLDDNIKRYKYLCLSLKYDNHIDISFEIDNEGEVIKTNTYKVNEDLSISLLSEDITNEDDINCLFIYESPYLIIDANYKPVKVEIKRIPKSEHLELGLGAELKDNHILSSAATVKLIENHKNHLTEQLTLSMDGYATKTRELEYTTEKQKKDEKDETSPAVYIFTLKKSTPNFSIKITFRWINADGKDDWYSITSKVINNKLSNTKLINGYNGSKTLKNFTFQGLSDSGTGLMVKELSYKDGIITMLTCLTPETYDLINYDPNETYFVENVVYGSDLNDYALKSSIPTDYINNESLTTTLNDYALKSSIPTIPSDIIDKETLTTTLNDYALKSDIPEFNINRYINYTYIKDTSTGMINFEFTLEKPISNLKCHVEFEWVNSSNEKETTYTDVKVRNGEIVERNIQHVDFTFYGKSGMVQTYMNDDYFVDEEHKYVVRIGINAKVYSELIWIKEDTTYFGESVVYTNDLNDYALKSSIPTIPDNLVNSESLTTTLNDYVKTSGNQTIDGDLNVSGTLNIGEKTIIKEFCDITGHFCYNNSTVFDYSIDGVVIAKNLTVLGKFTNNGSNTITHYSPIEQSVSSINDFIIGGPIYMSGKVYKRTNEGWQPSTVNDTTDCICSVKAKGKWNEYVGICVDIDEDNYSITFASHGDMLVKVNDTSLYSVGDEIFIDDDNVLKILSGNTAITSKIQRTTIGIITAKINDKFMAVFKS